MGINPQDRRYNVHHVLFRSDFKRNQLIRESYGLPYMDSKDNLFPLDKQEHARLHKLIEEIDRRHRR